MWTDLSEVTAKLLKELIEADPEVALALFENRYKVSDEIADHDYFVTIEGELGILGVINGILNASGNPKIEVVYDGNRVIDCVVRR